MIRIVIADDHAIVRSGLRQLFATTRDIVVVGEASTGVETLDHVRQSPLDLLLLDMTLPPPAGTELIRAVLALRSALPIVVLSMHNEIQIVSSVLKAGATAYVTKDSDPAVLFEAIRLGMKGGRYVDPALLEELVVGLDTSASGQQHELSERELQVLTLIADGLSLTDIGTRLHLSPKTVSTYKTRLMQKLGLGSNLELIQHALNQRARSALVDPQGRD